MKVRKLIESEVEFIDTFEEEDTDPRGNVLASGDESVDREAEREVIERLQRGDASAWCTVRSVARWKGYEGADVLGCVTLGDDYKLEQCIEEHGMHEEALSALNGAIARAAAELGELAVSEGGS